MEGKHHLEAKFLIHLNGRLQFCLGKVAYPFQLSLWHTLSNIILTKTILCASELSDIPAKFGSLCSHETNLSSTIIKQVLHHDFSILPAMWDIYVMNMGWVPHDFSSSCRPRQQVKYYEIYTFGAIHNEVYQWDIPHTYENTNFV